MESSLYNADINNWLQCVVWMVLKIFLPGAVWSRFLPLPNVISKDDRLSIWVFKASASLFVGFVIFILSALFLAELGQYTFLNEIILSGALTVTGVVLGAATVRASEPYKDHLSANLPGMAVFVLSIIVIMALPRASEWLLGGLDPGVYQNQGIYVERTGTFYPEPEPFFAALTDDEMMLFTRGDGGYRECMPGIPVSVETRSIQHYFFRLTPALIASVTRCGGLRAAVRTNYLVGFMAVLVFWSMLMVYRTNRSYQLFSVLFLVVQPVFLYQLHVPTTEMLQMLIILGICMLIPIRSIGVFTPIILGLSFFAATVNRLSFMPFAGILIGGISWLDKNRVDRRRVWFERIFMLLGLLVGVLFDCTVCQITLERLKDALPMMVTVATVFIVLALLLDILSVNVSFRNLWGKIPAWVFRLVLVSVMVFTAVLWAWGRKIGFETSYDTFHSILPYLGKVFFAAAMVGAVVLFWSCRGDLDGIRVMAAFMGAVTFIIVIKSFVEGNYPWAVRRFLVYTVPMLALFAGFLVSVVWNNRIMSRKIMMGLSVLLCLGLLVSTAKKSWHAWDRVEYSGMSRVLLDLASRIGDNDIVVIDTPTWGTPLKFTYGKNIVNGKHLWNRKSKEGMVSALKALERMRENGACIRFLTTTRTTAMEIYPVQLSGLNLDYMTDEIVLEEINHSRRARDFEIIERRNVFRMFTWTGSAKDIEFISGK